MEGFRLSPQQRYLWHLAEAGGGDAFRASCALRICGDLETAALRAALAAVVAEHEILRTSFRCAPVMRVPLQIIEEPYTPEIRVVDLSSRPAAQEEFLAGIPAGKATAFDPARPPLGDVALARLAPEEHLLALSLPALCADWEGLRLLVREISRAYTARVTGSPPAAPAADAPLQYADLAEWLNELLETPDAERGGEHWRALGLAGRLHPRLPFASPSGDAVFAPAVCHFFLDAASCAAVKELAGHSGVGLDRVLLSVWRLLLGRLTGEADPVVAAVCSGRRAEELAEALGLFAKHLPLSGRLDEVEPFSRILAATADALEQTARWQEYFDPRQHAADRFPAVAFEFAEPVAPWSDGGCTFSLLRERVVSDRFEIKLTARPDGEGCALTLEHDPRAVPAEVAERLVERYLRLLASVVAAPQAPVGSLDAMGERERRQVLVDFNRTAVELPRELRVHRLFAERAARSPQAVAVAAGPERLTYAELDTRANRLAHHLRRLGVGPDRLVGLFLERSCELVVALLAVLKARGAYLPLDPASPAERLRRILTDAGVFCFVTRQALAGLLPGEHAPAVLLDAECEALEGESDREPAGALDSDALAYVLYTSGSTGVPNGVMVSHGALANYLIWCTAAYRVTDGAGAPVHSPLGFDLTVTSLLSPLLAGRTVWLLPEEPGVEALYDALCERPPDGFSLVKITPAHLEALSRLVELRGPVSGVRALVVGGEALQGEALAPWSEVRRINEYGPTETVVGCCVCELAAGDEAAAGAVPIGRPIANTRLYVVDAWGNPALAGVPGELLIGGAGLARGYLGEPALTAWRFVPDPFGEEPGARLYRTGDLVRLRPDGALEFLGRTDHQIKLRGFRIEPGEIEAALVAHPAVREAAVVLREDQPGEPRLAAWLVTVPTGAPPPDDLLDFLRRRLPEPMIPSAFAALPELPLTSNGKIDRRTLAGGPAPERVAPSARYVAPRTPAEAALAAIWAEVLRLDRIGIHDSFFELGGDSILSLQVVACARRAGLRLAPKDLFEHRTIAALAAIVETAHETEAAQEPGSGPLPLTPIQRWFLEADPADPHHFNQALLLEARRPVAPVLLERALQQLVESHDALRLRFRRDAGEWRAETAPPGEAVSLAQIDLSALPAAMRGGAIAVAATEIQASLDLTRGPLVRAAWLATGAAEAPRLLAVVHHLAVDGVSWRILVEDLERAYGQLERGEEPCLPVAATSFRDWAHLLVSAARSPEMAREAAFWRAEAQRWEVARSPLGTALPGVRNRVGAEHGVTVALTEEETAVLLRAMPATYGTGIDDALLAALARALGDTTGGAPVLVDLEGHGREEVVPGLDLSRTVGWLTAIHPLLLETSWPGPAEALRAVRERRSAVPQRGIGYGLLRYSGASAAEEAETGGAAVLRHAPRAEILFNNLGQLDLPEGMLWRLAPEPAGESRSRHGERSHRLIVTARVSGGRLRVSFGYSTEMNMTPAIEALAGSFLAYLRDLLVQCLAADTDGYSPSDFPDVELSRGELDQILEQIS